MDPLLLTTKLNPPVIREARVSRPRLTDQLNTCLWKGERFARKLTLISASAGFGKTTLALDWLDSLAVPLAWISLDEEDNDPARFLAYLLAVCRQVNPQVGAATQALLGAPQPPAAEVLLTALINDLAALPAALILALDDYHAIHNPLIHRQVGFLLEHQPASLHLVVLTREDPLLPISRLRSRGQLCEIRQEDLSFTLAESEDFLRRVMGLDLRQDDVASLWRRTEGWAVGLELAALSLKSEPDPHVFILSFTGSHRYVLDYLFEEVFERQPGEIQDFLTCTAILDRLAPGLCDAVAGRRDSRHLLRSLEKANLFIVPLDQNREWYRYHRLFGELLRHRLRLQDEFSEALLHRRACAWYTAHGYPREAVNHALAAADWEQAGLLILAVSPEMLKRGEYTTLLGWFKQIPEALVRADPRLCLGYCWPLILASQDEQAESLLAHAEAFAQDDAAFQGEIAVAQAFLARGRGDFARMEALSRRAFSLLPEMDQAVRAILSLNLGLGYWHAGQMAEAEQMLDEARRAAQASGNVYVLLTAQIFLARVLAVRARLHPAWEAFQLALQQGGGAPILGIAHLDLGSLHYEWGELQPAREHARRGLALSAASGNAEFQIAAYLLLARLEMTLRDWSAAHAALNQARQLAQTAAVSLPNRARVDACQVELALAQGDLVAAADWTASLEQDVDAHPFYRFLGLSRERLLLAQGRGAQAAPLLAEKHRQAERAGWTYGLVVVRVLQALASGSSGEKLRFLREALDLAEPAGMLRSFADAGEGLAPLLQEIARRGVYPVYAGKILAAMGRKPARASGSSSPAGADLVEPLSEREIEALRLVGAGLSNREIAAALVISLGTAKTHLHNLYGKLGVGNRAQAFARARELGIL